MSLEQTLVELGKYLYDKPEIWGGIFAGAGLIYTARALKHQQESDQIKLAESVFKDLRALEKELSDIQSKIREANYVDAFQFEEKRLKADWRSRFFNTLEWLAFLINEGELRHKKIIGYYRDAIIHWYECIFTVQAADEEKSDPDIYPEMKKLYTLLKDGKNNRWQLLNRKLAGSNADTNRILKFVSEFSIWWLSMTGFLTASLAGYMIDKRAEWVFWVLAAVTIGLGVMTSKIAEGIIRNKLRTLRSEIKSDITKVEKRLSELEKGSSEGDSVSR